MSPLPSVTDIKVENCLFPAAIKPPGSNNTLFLGGAGVRGIQKPGVFVKVTEIGIYLESNAITSLADKWNGKTAEELTESLDFFRDIITGPFEKFTKVTMLLPLSGQQYAERVGENCVALMKEEGTYTEAEEKAIEKFYEIFKDENCPPGASILFTQSLGSLTISFSKDSSLPEVGKAVIENKPLAETLLESIIGKNGVSPAAKQSLATRISHLLKKENISTL